MDCPGEAGGVAGTDENWMGSEAASDEGSSEASSSVSVARAEKGLTIQGVPTVGFEAGSG